jgi:metallo-beta-lactamase class B
MRPILLLFFCLFFTALSYAQSGNDIKLKIDPVEPFRILGNIYYVGSDDVTSYLIVTPKGNILIDSGMKEMVPLVKTNIEKLGLKLSDIKIILNSHAHYDHAGGIAEMRRLTGAKFLASKPDAPLLERGGKGDPNFGDKYLFEPTKPDETFGNGKRISLGGTTLTANVTPGHTKGCTTWTTTVHEGGKDLNVIFVCSVSSPGYKFLNNRDYPEIEADYVRSFDWFRNAKVDVFLGSHAAFFDLEGKMKLLNAGSKTNPFVDPDGYKKYIAENEKEFNEKLKAQREASK